MSLFSKVLALFFISLTLMLFVSQKTDSLTQSSIKSLLKERYIQAADELFGYLANNDMEKLDAKIKELGFVKLKNPQLKQSRPIYQHKSDLSEISILKSSDERYLLLLRYLDDSVVLSDTSQEKYLDELQKLHYFIVGDIAILLVLFLVILKMLYPLKKISQKIQNFGEGNYNTRVDIQSSDEIGTLATNFNAMAKNIESLIESRERLLRDIGHELKTPISKSKFALEMIADSKYKQMLTRANQQMETMIDELLHIEKLTTKNYTLKSERFDMQTLISEALSRLFVENEADIVVNVEENFSIEADLFYMSIALKNLIDNALKYTTKKPIEIHVTHNSISVESFGPSLTRPLEYYCEAFTQEESSRNAQGYGLGLSLVKSILTKHNFKLAYSHKDGKNSFIIYCSL